MNTNITKKFHRQEYKYLITFDQYQKLKSYLKKRGLLPDNYSFKSENNQYYISSLYLDTSDYRFYWDKQYGVKDRLKYRLRTYIHKPSLTTSIFWEVKKKYGDFFIKDRFQLPWSVTKSFLNSSINLSNLLKHTSDQKALIRFYQTVINLNLKPSVLISYYREPWLNPNYPQLRLTFDHQIQAAKSLDLFFPHRQTTILPNNVVLEIKFSGSVPGYLSKLNQVFNLKRQSVSKYCLSLEACDIVSEENL